MHYEEEASKTMEILTILVGVTIQIFLGGNQNQAQGKNKYRPQGNAYGYQQQAQWEKPSKQPNNMSMEEMLKKIMADQAQLAADVRNNQLATQNLEK